MNPLRTAYCRVFQTIFRAALPILPYRKPKILHTVEEAADLLVDEHKTHPLIVTGKNIHKLGLIDGLEAALTEHNIAYSMFDETVPNPTIANVEAARAMYLADGCDCLIAFGGGSPMDCAKVVGARIVRPNKPVSKMRGLLHIRKRLPLLIAVPTTAGTGSETTLAAVITDEETHYKYPINDFSLIPHVAVLDYRTTLGLPKNVTSVTGIDALVHAVEAYIGRSTIAQTREDAETAVRLIHDNLKRAYDDGSDIEAREGMLHAAYSAGAAFTKSYVGYCHGVAHSLGGQYGIAHGLANAVICPYLLDLYGKKCYKRLGKLARAGEIAPQDASDAEASHIFIDWFRELNASLDIPDKLDGIREEDIPSMAKRADKESNPLYPVPVEMDAHELERIYHLVMAPAAANTESDTAASARPAAQVSVAADTTDTAGAQIAASAAQGQTKSQQDIQAMVARQRAFFATGKTIDVEYRRAALRHFREAIKRRENDIYDALHEDLGKAVQESFMCEVGLTLAELNYQIGHVRRWARPHRVLSDITNFQSNYHTIAEPYGVTLIMSPWNYPILLTLEPLVGALAAGNCCIVKPSDYSPATSQIIAELVAETFEPGYVDVVRGGRAENTELLDQHFDYIFFTGSVPVGKLVMDKASVWPTPVSLELGGKSPCIITADADLKRAAARIAFGKYLNCGQTCVAVDYVLVQDRVADEFVDLLCGQISKMYGSDAFENPDWGHIINQKHFDRISGLIEPDKVVYGGRGKQETLQIEPTVMRNITGDDAVMQQEIFGPVLPILTYTSLDEAEQFIKERPTPLALYLFTKDHAIEDRFLRYVPYGGGCINDTVVHLATSHMPFGGMGESGIGSYHGRKSFETFSHEKSILKKRLWLDMPMRYQPYRSINEKIIRLLMR